MRTATTMNEAALYRLMAWLSPSYPLGAYSYSHGLEFAVERGLVRDADSLLAWIGTILSRGAGRIDGAVLAAAWRAVCNDDEMGLQAVAEQAAAWRGSAELALESEAQGAAFLATTRSAWPHPALERLAAAQVGRAIALPVAVGVAAASHGIALAPALAAYLQAFAANLVSAGIRLIPLGQSAGQRAVAALEKAVADAARAAGEAELEEIGTSALIVDWCSMQHETQYTRLFRS